mgnify:CR=1 FL=1
MVWDNLGTVAVGPEWKAFDISSLDDSLLRITQTYTQRPIGYALISSVFSDGSRGFFQRIYPYNGQQRLIEYVSTAVLREPGFNFRFLEVKASVRLRAYDLSWEVTVEIWSADQVTGGLGDQVTGGEQIFDGGLGI